MAPSPRRRKAVHSGKGTAYLASNFSDESPPIVLCGHALLLLSSTNRHFTETANKIANIINTADDAPKVDISSLRFLLYIILIFA